MKKGGQRLRWKTWAKAGRSIYMLSLLETYVAEPDRIPSIILVEDPEIFLPSPAPENVL